MADSQKNRGALVGNVIMLAALGWSVWAYYHPYRERPASTGASGPLPMTMPAWPIIALVIAVLGSGVFQWLGARERRLASGQRGRKAAPISGSDSYTRLPLVELWDSSPDGRVYLHRLPLEIREPYADRTLTSRQADEQVAPLIGQVVRWRIAVSNVEKRDGADHAEASFRLNSMEWLTVYMEFVAGSPLGDLSRVSRDDVIKMEGNLSFVNRDAIRIKECRLIASERPAG